MNDESHEVRIEMEVSEMSESGFIPPGGAKITDVLVDGKSIKMDLDEAERIGQRSFSREADFTVFARRHWTEILDLLRERDQLKRELSMVKDMHDKLVRTCEQLQGAVEELIRSDEDGGREWISRAREEAAALIGIKLDNS